MAKKKINNYVFEPGISKDANLYPNAYALLIANKDYILAEMVAYINYSIEQNLAPYFDTYVYDSSKCFRDIGYVIDAVAHDLRYGGNVQIRMISSYFWIDGKNQLRPEHITGELAALNYARDLINNFIFTNTPVSPARQTLVTQTFINGSNAESGASTRITNEMSIITTVITDGTSAIPEKVPGVSSIRMMDKYTAGDFLLITNTNTGDVLYNFADPANALTITYKSGYSTGGGYLYDLDFPRWYQTGDYVTTIFLSADSSEYSSSDDIQIFVEDDFQTIRPWEFGTDAIERMRVAAPQAMLDADFEYGLQPTKWQAIGLERSYPSLYEIPGTDAQVTAVTTDASATNGFFGSSLITVTTQGAHGLSVGTPITIKGLNSAVLGSARAEGSFLIYSIPRPNELTYYASSRVGTADGDDLYTGYVQLRQAGFYTGAAIGSPTFSVYSNGTASSVTTVFDSPNGAINIAFDGTAPSPGSPVSGSPALLPGTSISGVVGASTISASVKYDALSTDNTLQVTDPSGIQAGMAVSDGAGGQITVNQVSGSTIYFSDNLGQNYTGSDGVVTNVSGINQNPIGSGATWSVSRSGGVYTVSDSGDSSSNGQNYQIGDRIKILGTALGGATPANDLIITVSDIDSGGAITNTTSSGLGISGGATYNNISQIATSGSGIGALITVVRQGGTGNYEVTLSSGGSGYAPGDTITYSGTSFGGSTPDNDIVIQVNGVSFGTEAVVDFVVTSGQGVSGDASYTSLTGTNVNPSGTGATFDVTKSAGSYAVAPNADPGNIGNGYAAGDKILIRGNLVGGSTPTNDLLIRIVTVDGSGGVLGVTTLDGITPDGDPITFYPTFTLADPLEDAMPADTLLNVGAIATLEVNFTGNHGLVPGSSILTKITSTPAPALTSTDSTLASSGTWTGVANTNGVFVAVKSGSTATAKSNDGSTWTNGGTLTTGLNWSSIAAGIVGSTYYWVTVPSNGQPCNYSSDGGDTWSAANLPASGTWTSVGYYDGTFVAVRSGSNQAAFSTNGGASWTAATLPSSTTWTDVAGGLIGSVVYWVAIASGGTASAYSVDGGATWSAMGALPASATWSSVAYGNNSFVAIASGSTSAAYSNTGTTWASSTLPASTSWNSITYGDEVFVAVASNSTIAAVSFTGAAGSWTQKVLSSNAAWEEIAYGYYGNASVFAVVGNNTSALTISLQSANHGLAAGPFIVTEVPSLTSIRYPARTLGQIDDTTVSLNGTLYARPDVFFVHRPFDGGVQLGTGGPVHGVQAIRQSKKYIRYQSGKGIMYTTGALFAPNYNISSMVAVDTVPNSLISVTCDDTDHGLQTGAVIEILGAADEEFNGIFTVDSVKDARTFRVRAATTLPSTTATLGPDAKIITKGWHGSVVRTGPFDEQNGLFFQYNGREMCVVRRSSTFQIAGTVAVDADSNEVTGSGTRFQDQLKVGDRVVLRGMSHTVTSITSQTSLTFNPDFRGNSNITGAKMCVTQDMIIPQSEWNIDRADGTGPSGYNWNPGRMQMIGMQYSWYAAGFVEFMCRGSDGRFIFLHRLRNSNINTEAYMRTANLPVRYEVENGGTNDKLAAAMTSSSSSIQLVEGYFFPDSGVVYIDNELIAYSAKNGNTLTGLTRATTFSNFSAGSNRTYSAGAAASHAQGAGVILIDCTTTPTISHWGSALLTDGMFDEDRGYLFSYASTGLSISTTKTTAFLIRLAPSVSNAIVGDLGDRDLLNRAQLLLSEITVTADTVSGGGGIVVEGVLNPQNYPTNPANISWGGLAGLSQGGQPSFAQIAPGGTVDWSSGASQTTKTATTASGVNLNRTNYLYFTATSWEATGATVGTEVSDSKFPAGTRVSQVYGPANYVGGSPGSEYVVYFTQSSNTNITGGSTVTFIFGQPPYALPGETIFSFIANPGERATLDLSQLKELTTTSIGGRGAFPNGPDVLAINVYKVAGTTTTGNIILRWSEAQA